MITSLALPHLERSDDSRVVIVSSGGAYNTKWPEFAVAAARKGRYDGNMSYAYQKRGQILLCERWAALHPSIKFVTAHPGWTQTPAVDAAYGTQKKYLEPLRTPWQGSFFVFFSVLYFRKRIVICISGSAVLRIFALLLTELKFQDFFFLFPSKVLKGSLGFVSPPLPKFKLALFTWTEFPV